jgi:hypothetical protein
MHEAPGLIPKTRKKKKERKEASKQVSLLLETALGDR